MVLFFFQLGLGKMFSAEADFSGMVDPPPALAVSEAVQKTFMEVNEEGTEAAAATGESIFPFLFLINRRTFLVAQSLAGSPRRY